MHRNSPSRSPIPDMSAIGKTQIAATGVLFGKRSLATPQG
jgi:hypothetical protein